MTSEEPVIQLVGVKKVYGKGDALVYALAGVDLTIRAGEFVAIMGASGSGKSTSMNIIGCLDVPSAGSYRFRGAKVEEMTADERAMLRRLHIGFVFQGFNLLPRTTAIENVELPLVYRRVPTAERQRRAIEALETVGLGDRLHHVPSELSGGQQQRVAIARALASAPALLLADEPTGNLDSRRSAEIMQLLVQLNQERGITIVMVTHEPDMAAFASRCVHFKDGLIIGDGVPAEVFGPPSSSAGGAA